MSYLGSYFDWVPDIRRLYAAGMRPSEIWTHLYRNNPQALNVPDSGTIIYILEKEGLRAKQRRKKIRDMIAADLGLEERGVIWATRNGA